MEKKLNKYSVIVFFENSDKPKKWNYVHKLNGFSLFLKEKHSDWLYMNVYDRKTGHFLKRFHPTDFIPAFLN